MPRPNSLCSASNLNGARFELKQFQSGRRAIDKDHAGEIDSSDTSRDGSDRVLNIRPKDLLDRARHIAPIDARAVRRGRAPRPVPPSWRTCRLIMSRAQFAGIVGAWVGTLALLLVVALTIRWS